MKECIYQNSRGHSTSGIVGEIVTLSPGFGSISLEVLRGRRAHLMGHGFLGLWGGGQVGTGHTRETERIKEKMNICSRSKSGRDRRDGSLWKVQEQEKVADVAWDGKSRTMWGKRHVWCLTKHNCLYLLNCIHLMLERAQLCDHTATCSK